MDVFEHFISGTVDPIMMFEVFFFQLLASAISLGFYSTDRRDKNVFNKKILNCVPECEGKANVIRSAKRMLSALHYLCLLLPSTVLSFCYHYCV